MSTTTATTPAQQAQRLANLARGRATQAANRAAARAATGQAQGDGAPPIAAGPADSRTPTGGHPDPFSDLKNTIQPLVLENPKSVGLGEESHKTPPEVGGGVSGVGGEKSVENLLETGVQGGEGGVKKEGENFNAGEPVQGVKKWASHDERRKNRVMKTAGVAGLPRSGGERANQDRAERKRWEAEQAEIARVKAEAQAIEDAKGPRYERAKLYPKQEACFFGAERWSLTEATTKGGKTSGAIVWLAEKAILGKEGQNFWWVAPVFPQAEVAYRRMAKAFPYDLRATHDSKMRISLANGTAIWFKSGETPDNLYGEDVYAAVVDEASRLREESWHALRSTLTATKGQARMIGNVKGRRNWFYAMCRKAEGGEPNMAYHKLTWRDAVEAGVIDAREIDDARSLLPPAVFQELYEADAADDSGNPFGNEAIAECVAKCGGLVSTDPVTCWGWDLGKRQDWSCGVGLDRLQRVAQVERFQMPWREAKDRIAKVTARLPALVDSTGVGDVVLEDLQATGSNFEGYYFTGKSKQELMNHLRNEVQGRRIAFPDGVIRTEMDQFEYEYTRTAVLYSAPPGCHDDAVIGLALASKHFATHGPGHFQFARNEKLERGSYERGGRERAILI